MESTRDNQTSRGGVTGTERNYEEGNGDDLNRKSEICSNHKLRNKVNYFRHQRKKNSIRSIVTTTIPRSNKIIQALNLPKVANLNPRSIYNKIEEFYTFVIEEEIDIVCLSESHERWYTTHANAKQTLNEIINIDDHIVISNPSQRIGKGGRLALVVDNTKYMVHNLTQNEIVIPWGVEMVWAVLTPFNTTLDSEIQKIVVGSLYCKPNSRKKNCLIRPYSRGLPNYEFKIY